MNAATLAAPERAMPPGPFQPVHDAPGRPEEADAADQPDALRVPGYLVAAIDYFDGLYEERHDWRLLELLKRWYADFASFDGGPSLPVRRIEAAAETAWKKHQGGCQHLGSARDAILGSRTAADLEFGPPPEPLLDPFLSLDPGESMVLYGPGGAGKSTIAAWLLGRWVATSEESAAILDFENHASEWGRRLRGLGLDEGQLTRIQYRSPFASDWDPPFVSLHQAADALQADLARHRVGLTVVDSIVMASDGDAAMGGVEAAKQYFAGLATIGVRSVSLGHVAGAATKWPDKPFGSSYVHNLARETWAIEQTSNATDEALLDAVLKRQSSRIRVELHNQKLSNGARRPPAIYDVEFFANGEIRFSPVKSTANPKDLVRGVLAQTPKLTVDQIVKAIAEDTDVRVTPKQVTNALDKHSDDFEAEKSKRPFRWSNR